MWNYLNIWNLRDIIISPKKYWCAKIPCFLLTKPVYSFIEIFNKDSRLFKIIISKLFNALSKKTINLRTI